MRFKAWWLAGVWGYSEWVGVTFGCGAKITRKLGVTDISQVAQQVHGLMVTQQNMDLATRRTGLTLQITEQIHYFTRPSATVEHVPQAYQVRCARYPTIVTIDELIGP